MSIQFVTRTFRKVVHRLPFRGCRVYGQHAGKTTLRVRTPYYRDDMGAPGYPATAGSKSPTDIVD
jgi:hypothetical protein